MATELLAPAGNKESFLSAINHGADAVYVGGFRFGARASADNFSNDDLKEMIKYAHKFNVKVYVTVNTLLKDNEIEDALSFVSFLHQIHVDAILIQDLGFAHLVHEMFPKLILHASTQMNIHSVGQAMFLQEMGFKRIVLARETPIEIVKEIIEKVDIEIEIFVHGALCMAYSGNCYLSSIIGKRSGNRGRCAQPCRLEYSLEGTNYQGYLLNSKDLMLLEKIKSLQKLGVHSFKIEGRMKRPEYVGLVTEVYKKAINDDITNIEEDIKNLKLMFHRQFTKGYLYHEENNLFTNIKSPNHIGIEIGKVIKTNFPWCTIELNNCSLSRNDSIRIVGKVNDAITFQEIPEIKQNKIIIRTHEKVEVGSIVLKTTDAKLIEKVNNIKPKKILIKAKLSLENEYLVLELFYENIHVKAISEYKCLVAKQKDFSKRIIEQIQKTNNTDYEITNINDFNENVFLPISVINNLRRKAITLLDEEFNKREDQIPYVVKEYKQEIKPLILQPKLHVKVRTTDQLEALLDFNDIEIYTEDESLINDFSSVNHPIHYVNPRIETKKIKDGMIQNHNLIGNNHLISSPYMNVTNAYSVYLLHQKGINIVGLSIELSKNEIKQLVTNYQKLYHNNPNVYVMLYGYYELMIMKHCPIQKALNKQQKPCGACYLKQYYLVDRLGFRFPLLRSDGCQIKLMNCKRVHLLQYMNELKEIGINQFYLDFTIETKEETLQIMQAYYDMFNHISENISLSLNDVTYGHFKEGII